MATIGLTLAEIKSLVRSHAGMSPNAGLNVQNNQALTDLINSTQRILYNRYEWENKWCEHTKALVNGQFLYDFPTTLDWDHVRGVQIRWAQSSYLDVCYGIDSDQYNAIDTRSDIRQDPVQRWKHRVATDGTPQFEVWPIPASDGNTLYFDGMQKLPKLVADTDRSHLDGDLLALYAAASRLGGAGSKEGQAKLLEAKECLSALKNSKNLSSGRLVGVSGGGPHRGAAGVRNVRVLVARSP